MLGLMVLLALGVYLAISALVVWLAARWAKKRGRRGWAWGGVAAFAMYNLVFWDLIPTLAMHKYYCATEAGFWVYKTPEQWVKENPGVRETLKESLSPDRVTYRETGKSLVEKLPENTRRSWYTQRFFIDTASEEIFLSMNRIEGKFYDRETGNLLVRAVSFTTGRDIATFVSGGTLEGWRQTLVFGGFAQGCSVNGKAGIDGSSTTHEFYRTVYQFWKSGEGK